MNPVVPFQLLVAIFTIAAAVPLIRRKVKMNPWYGIRIRAAFESDERWFDINHYGGWLFLVWGMTIAITAIFGAFLEKKDWITYDLVALVIIMSGLFAMVALIFR